MLILRAAVNGETRGELCDNLRKLADDIMSHDDDNSIGELDDFSFDFQIDEMEEGEMVSLLFFGEQSINKGEEK